MKIAWIACQFDDELTNLVRTDEIELRYLDNKVVLARATALDSDGRTNKMAVGVDGIDTAQDQLVAVAYRSDEATRQLQCRIATLRYLPQPGAAPVTKSNGSDTTIHFHEIESHEHPSVNDDVEFTVERMGACGLDQAVVADLTRSDVGIPVVRVIVPRAEAWTFYLTHAGRATIGHRVLQEIQRTCVLKRGDLENAADDHDVIVILDGEFGQSRSVSPKEILGVLDGGKTVVGAASMGALRASELDRYGMIGVGWVYDYFRRSIIRPTRTSPLCTYRSTSSR